jgi:lipoprotein-anchoring transpeptidase ErfK/SrfK
MGLGSGTAIADESDASPGPGPSAAIRLLPAPPAIKPGVKPKPKTGLAWASPAPNTLFFRPATITLDWTGAVPLGVTYSVALSEDGKSFNTLLADNITDSHFSWALPDVPRTTLYLRVRASAVESGQLVSKVLPIHVVPGDAIVVSKKNQRLWAFRDGRLRQRYLVSTGQIDYDTRAGWFNVYSRQKEHHSLLYDVDMPFALFFSGGQAIHASTALRQLGRPASHGCVRLPRRHAQTLFQDSTVGRPVIITDWRQDMSWLDAVPRAATARAAGGGKPVSGPVSRASVAGR